jgi:hypothetical protein
MTRDEAAAIVAALVAAGLFDEEPPVVAKASPWKLSGLLPDLTIEELRCRSIRF